MKIREEENTKEAARTELSIDEAVIVRSSYLKPKKTIHHREHGKDIAKKKKTVFSLHTFRSAKSSIGIYEAIYGIPSVGCCWLRLRLLNLGKEVV